MQSHKLQFILDSPIAFHRCLASITGSVCSGLMLSQAIYWSNRTDNPDGWFWKTQEEWEKETSMTRYEQEGARKLLKESGFWEEKLTGVPAKMHYRINFDVLDKVLSQTSMGKNHILDGGKTPNKTAEKPQTIGTKTTSETTSKTTTTARAPEIEFPHGFPQTEEQAVIESMSAGVPDDFVRREWNECAGRNGTDRSGKPVHRWAFHCKGAWGAFADYTKRQDNRFAGSGAYNTQTPPRKLTAAERLAECLQ